MTARMTWSVRIACPVCGHVIAWQRGIADETKQREGPRPVLVCGSRRCGASVRTMAVEWKKERIT